MGLRMASPWKHPESGFFYLRERVPVAIAEQAKGRRVVAPVDGQPIAVAVNGLVKTVPSHQGRDHCQGTLP